MSAPPSWLISFANQLHLLDIASAVVPAAVGLWRRRQLTTTGRYLWVCVLLAGFVCGPLNEYGRIVWGNNILVLRSQVWLEAILPGLAYYQAFVGPARRRGTLAAMVVFTLGSLFETFWLMDWRQGNGPYMHVAQAVLIIGLALTYFEQSTRLPSSVSLLRDPLFVASIGLLTSCAGTVFVYVLEGLMRDNTDMIRLIFMQESFLRIVALNGCLAWALWLDGRAPVAEAPAQ